MTVTTTQDDIDGADIGMWCGNIMTDGVWQKLICTYVGSSIDMALESDYGMSGLSADTIVQGGHHMGTEFTILNTEADQSQTPRFRIDAIEIFAQAKTA